MGLPVIGLIMLAGIYWSVRMAVAFKVAGLLAQKRQRSLTST